MSTNTPSFFGSIATNFIVSVAAAAGAFVLTLVLQSEKMQPGAKKTQFSRGEHKEGHQELNIEEAQELVEKLSSHVSVPPSLN